MSTFATANRSDTRPSRAASVALGIFTALHGIAHFAGMAASLESVDEGTAEPYLGGAWEISAPAALRVLAGIWAVLAVAYLVVAVLVLLRHRRARSAFLTVTALSLVLTVLALWAAAIGVIINVALLALVTLAAPKFFR